jgi:hypothetical protein
VDLTIGKWIPRLRPGNQAGQIGVAQIASLVFKFYGVKIVEIGSLEGFGYVVELK